MEKQVIVRICSGLGNQMFQMACGMATAAKLGATLACDTTWYPLVSGFHRPVRQFRLGHLLLPTGEAFRGVRRLAVGLMSALYDRTGRGGGLLQQAGNMVLIQERQAMRSQRLDCPDDARRIYLNGYWQTADHFLAIREPLLPLLAPRNGISGEARHWVDRIQSRQTCFVHVRRGDYAELVGDSGLLPVEYYRRAAATVTDRLGEDVQWIVFAEDHAWARQNMGFLPGWQLVDYASDQRDIEDLQLMAACDAGIIANSSYSWWGAAMGDRAGRLIIAPDRYWNRGGADTTAWRLPSWQAVTAWPDPA
ncbi:MAG: alpha-1,2-fucosyltransferase [Chthoniobacterales bacterium]|nr:alpha-1,2-fucosyltransferase [Chthoniobacterales bacterium]